jgi:iron uptake system component EfeO
MTGTARRWIVAGGASVLLLAGCTANQPAPTTSGSAAAADGVLTVSSTADSCTVSAATAKSGNTTFKVTNDGDKTTEFYLLGDDGLRIVAERENIAPGSSADLSVALQPGSYFTACKPGMRGENVGEAAFTVTGEPIQLSGEDQELFDAAVVDYVNFVKNEVAELQPNVEKFAKAYADGDDETARSLFATTRVSYERIEPIAEALGGCSTRGSTTARSTTSPRRRPWPATTRPSPSGWASTGWRRTSGCRRRTPYSRTGRPPGRAGSRPPRSSAP